MLLLILCYRDLQQPNNLNVNSKKSAKLRRLHISSCPCLLRGKFEIQKSWIFYAKFSRSPATRWCSTHKLLEWNKYEFYSFLCISTHYCEILSQKLCNNKISTDSAFSKQERVFCYSIYIINMAADLEKPEDQDLLSQNIFQNIF